jgi:hypothetical protein
MVRIIRSLGDSLLSALLPSGTAQACIPNEPYYTCETIKSNACWSLRPTPLEAYMYCTNNCAGVYSCTWTGDCCA